MREVSLAMAASSGTASMGGRLRDLRSSKIRLSTSEGAMPGFASGALALSSLGALFAAAGF